MLDRRIELFLTVAETGSMSAASKQLYMAQPTLSQQMSALEKDLDVTLLERGSRGVSRHRPVRYCTRMRNVSASRRRGHWSVCAIWIGILEPSCASAVA